MADTDSDSEYIATTDLRIGHFVFIDLGWLSHPFSLNAFKIRSQEQIDTIRALGLTRIRYSLERSEPENSSLKDSKPAIVLDPVAQARHARLEILGRQRASLKACERHYNDASKAYRQVTDIFHAQPDQARGNCEKLIGSIIEKLLGEEESSIRLLSEQSGERNSLHSVNVAVISLLLAKSMSLDAGAMNVIGIGALLHDIGKFEIPSRLRFRTDQLTQAEFQIYQEHVSHGVTAGRKMGLPPEALLVIGQHHEFADGSGYPQKIRNDRISLAGRVVALVNHYDSLCNPGNPSQGLTPHEALALMFAQQKARFDGSVMAAFIRMMGVYPPGSVVQLNDDRYALVVSVNSNRPLKPQVVIYQPEIPRDEALVVDLEQAPELGIRRSLKPLQLPKAAIDYLSPRERICYFFERARNGDSGEDVAG